MSKLLSLPLMLIATACFAQTQLSSLPRQESKDNDLYKNDWLVTKTTVRANVYRDESGKNIILDNGLLRRTFHISSNLSCIGYKNLSSGEELIRAISPEAKVTINGKLYNVGGLIGQKEKAYLKYEWLDTLKSGKTDFKYAGFNIDVIKPYVKWKPSLPGGAMAQPGATGKLVSFLFTSGLPELNGVRIRVNYELYDGMPVMCKWVSVENTTDKSIKVNGLINEVLAVHEEESSVVGSTAQMKTPHGIYIESNYAYNDAMNARLSDQTTHWKADSSYTSQVNYEFKTPCVLEVYPPIGPGVRLKKGETLNSIRTVELLLDSYDRERNGLAQKRMYKSLIPWANQNPMFLHLVSTDPKVVKAAVDQCAATGYEAIILSFGSGIDLEDPSEENIRNIKALVDYAHSKNIILGGYTLFSSRRINDAEDVIDPKTGKADVHAMFLKAPCLGSKWGLNYLKTLKEVIARTGLDLVEFDGPYPGDVCASKLHPGHDGLDDSQWKQMELQKDFFRWCSERGVYVNAPDWYFFDGTHKIALGYREVNFSLPREQQILLNRQNMYDGTWEKMPSMSWGFVPLTEYHGGGAAATLEPLSEHLDAYRQLMMQYYGSGIQACYRGPRLYDTERTKKEVIDVVTWYKKYRRILNADVIHLRRPDARDWDGIMHVDPHNKEKGLAMLYNPTDKPISREIALPMYYTGLTKSASIREKDGKQKNYRIENGTIKYNAEIPAQGYTWLVIE